MNKLIKILIYFIFCSLILTSCSSPQKSQKSATIPLDPKLVRSYAFDLENLLSLDSPFYAEYNYQKKRLIIIAVDHIAAADYPNLIEHPTLKTIETVFNLLKPEVSVVEGVQDHSEQAKDSLLKKAESCKKESYAGDCGESFFAINKALETKTHFLSGEPTDRDVTKFVVESGYDKADLIGFYLLRKIPQWKRQNKNNKAEIENLATEQLERYRNRIDPNISFSMKEFKAWYSTKVKSPKNYYDITNTDAAPNGGPDATFLQKISNRVTFARDLSLLNKIESSLSSYNRVLVVYGGSHFINIEPALTKALGQPLFKKPHYH